MNGSCIFHYQIVSCAINMAQSYVNSVRINSEEVGVIASEDDHQKRKVNLSLDSYHHVSVFLNGQGETVINIKKGTRSVSISKQALMSICDLKETLLLCSSFVENKE